MDFIGTMDVIKARKGQWKTPVKKTSPNDVKCVVWATAERQQQQQRLHITTGRSVDTACFSAGTDAANFGVLFQQLLYKLHLG